ncbi:Trimeric LpxA-like superfamily [Sesbania bispinosa]|nr:Trimeric LpxA-like superfamily [Sesbania bispinosa]
MDDLRVVKERDPACISHGRKVFAVMIQNRVSEVFEVDIHPDAKNGCGTGKVYGDRHPKIGDEVLIGARTCISGNIKIGVGSVVIKEVPPRTTIIGNLAKFEGGKKNPIKLDKIHCTHGFGVITTCWGGN